MPRMRTLKLIFLPCLVLLSVTLPHLEQGDFRRDTGRYAAVGHYMWSGGSLLAPHLDPETPYFNKPPLAVLIHGFFLKVFGVHLAVARLPSILAALGVVVLSVLSVRQIGSRSEAIVSGLVLALTYEFFRRTREISLDMWQLLFVMVAVYGAVTALRTRNRLMLALTGIPLGMALLCKPLNAFAVIPILAIWALLARQPRMLSALFLGALPLAVLVAAPWHLYMVSTFGEAFTQRYFLHEVVKRARGLEMTQPFYYYVLENLATYWPWLLGLVFAGYIRFVKSDHARRPGRDLVVLGGTWSLIVLVGLSLFPDKKPNYALPLYPMLSWIVAAGLCRLPWRRLRSWYAGSFLGLAPAATVALVVLSVAPFQFQKPPDKHWQAVLGWLRANRVEHARVFYGTIEQNDLCYFYLQTGHWLGSAAKREAAGVPAASSLILTRWRSDAAKPAPAAVLFSSGELALVPGSVPVSVEIRL